MVPNGRRTHGHGGKEKWDESASGGRQVLIGGSGVEGPP
jgi:hypothetical protein